MFAPQAIVGHAASIPVISRPSPANLYLDLDWNFGYDSRYPLQLLSRLLDVKLHGVAVDDGLEVVECVATYQAGDAQRG